MAGSRSDETQMPESLWIPRTPQGSSSVRATPREPVNTVASPNGAGCRAGLDRVSRSEAGPEDIGRPTNAANTAIGRLAFVVLTFNARDLLRRCVASVLEECALLANSIPSRVIVVDNASSDGTPEMVRDEFPAVHLIVNSENLGPARGFNLGIAKALEDSDTVVIVNSDVVILPRTVETMLAFLTAHPEVDGVSGPLFNPDMTRQQTRTHIVRLLPVNRAKPFREDFPGTGFAMIRARAFRKVGGYDENYYFYNEDLDWATRAKAAGCIFYYVPCGGVIHFGGQGRKQNVSRIVAELYRGNIYYYKRHYPRFAWIALILLRLEISWRIRNLRRGLSRTRHPARDRISESVSIYLEARRRMEEEYLKRTHPRIPTFT